MPVITIRLLEGRTLEQKRELTKVVSEAVSQIAKTPLDGVHVIFEDVPRASWGRGGILFADRDPR
jgi:4-oxalocrotonate tautomerase